MIVIRVELHSARTGKVTEIARMMIHNVGQFPANVGKGLWNYGVEVYRGRSKVALDKSMKNRSARRMGAVQNHPSDRVHVWHLVAKALKACEYGDH